MAAVKRGLREALGVAKRAPVSNSGDRTVPIALDHIREGVRLRPLDPNAVEQLQESIARSGLQTPLLVRPFAEVDPEDPDRWGPETPGHFVLIAGSHRLEACRRSGLTHVAAFVRTPSPAEARLLEIDENFVRADLTPLDRAVFLAKRKEIYHARYPEARRGGDRSASRAMTPSFADASAATTGLAPRTIQRAVAIYRGLSSGARAALAGTPLAQNERALYSISRLPEERQETEIARRLTTGPTPKRPPRDGVARLDAAWRAATRSERRRFLTKHGLPAAQADRIL